MAKREKEIKLPEWKPRKPHVHVLRQTRVGKECVKCYTFDPPTLEEY